MSGVKEKKLSYNKSGSTNVWWHQGERGPLERFPYINQFGHMKFTKIVLDENMKPHLNDGIEIHYVERGRYDWTIEGRSVELYPDDLSITAPWQLNGSPNGKMDLGEINWMVLKPEVFSTQKSLKLGKWTNLPKRFQKELGKLIAEEQGIVLKRVRNFKHYFHDIKRELENKQEGYELIVVNLLENLLIQLKRELESKKQQTEIDDSFILSLQEIIKKDLARKWPVEDLARKFGMGRTKFTNEVRRLSGYPPNSYIINLRLDEAKSMLGDSRKTLSDIAYTCGFSSLQHFTSCFSQRTGITPAVYRASKVEQ